MGIDETQRVINDYFAVMGAHSDFSQFYTEDVTWTMIDAGVETRGAGAVRDYVVALHGQMTDVRTHRIAVSGGAACLEGDCINVQKTDAPRIAYCVVYDLVDNRITAMRCYGTFGAMVTQILPADS